MKLKSFDLIILIFEQTPCNVYDWCWCRKLVLNTDNNKLVFSFFLLRLLISAQMGTICGLEFVDKVKYLEVVRDKNFKHYAHVIRLSTSRNQN